MQDYIAQRLHQEVREHTFLLQEIARSLGKIERILTHLNISNVTSGTIKGDTDMPLTPGSTATFTVTPEPSNATLLEHGSVWSSTDNTNAPVTVDSTGLIATVTFPETATVGAPFTLTWTYTNADGTYATASISETIVAPVIDVTGGTITQTI